MKKESDVRLNSAGPSRINTPVAIPVSVNPSIKYSHRIVTKNRNYNADHADFEKIMRTNWKSIGVISNPRNRWLNHDESPDNSGIWVKSKATTTHVVRTSP